MMLASRRGLGWRTDQRGALARHCFEPPTVRRRPRAAASVLVLATENTRDQIDDSAIPERYNRIAVRAVRIAAAVDKMKKEVRMGVSPGLPSRLLKHYFGRYSSSLLGILAGTAVLTLI
jgi:hypothetical protein